MKSGQFPVLRSSEQIELEWCAQLANYLGCSLEDFKRAPAHHMDYPPGTVRIELMDGSQVQFKYALALVNEHMKAIGVFSEHCGNHIFPWHEAKLFRDDKLQFAQGDYRTRMFQRPQNRISATNAPMRREDIEKIVEESFSRNSSPSSTSRRPREEIVERKKANLRARICEPQKIYVRPSEWAIKNCGFENKAYSMVSVATHGTNWLFYEENSGLFFKAGEVADKGPFLAGYFSDDALKEWLS
jgi:hypothetical protein